MSTNVDTVHYVGDGRLYIRRGDAIGAFITYEDDLPEANFLEEFDYTNELYEDSDAYDEKLLLEDVNFWGGQRSGTAFDLLCEKLLPMTEGFAQLVFVVEGGSELIGLEVYNGVVQEKRVGFRLLDD